MNPMTRVSLIPTRSAKPTHRYWDGIDRVEHATGDLPRAETLALLEAMRKRQEQAQRAATTRARNKAIISGFDGL
jgi:hypothetical protein